MNFVPSTILKKIPFEGPLFGTGVKTITFFKFHQLKYDIKLYVFISVYNLIIEGKTINTHTSPLNYVPDQYY